MRNSFAIGRPNSAWGRVKAKQSGGRWRLVTHGEGECGQVIVKNDCLLAVTLTPSFKSSLTLRRNCLLSNFNPHRPRLPKSKIDCRMNLECRNRFHRIIAEKSYRSTHPQGGGGGGRSRPPPRTCKRRGLRRGDRGTGGATTPPAAPPPSSPP